MAALRLFICLALLGIAAMAAPPCRPKPCRRPPKPRPSLSPFQSR